MQTVIRMSGYWNLALAIPLLHPALYGALGMKIPHPFFGRMIGGLVLYTAATLILTARQPRPRASFLAWEGVLRFLAAGLLLTEGEVVGPLAVPLGLADLGWGAAFFVLLRREGISITAALRDEVPAATAAA